MEITNKQHLANLLHYMRGINVTNITLPGPNGHKNSVNDNRKYADSWTDEFFNLRQSDGGNTIEITTPGASLYAYNFILDEQRVHIVALEYDSVEPEGVFMSEGHCADCRDVVESWLGMTTIAEHENHAIQIFAQLINYEH